MEGCNGLHVDLGRGASIRASEEEQGNSWGAAAISPVSLAPSGLGLSRTAPSWLLPEVRRRVTPGRLAVDDMTPKPTMTTGAAAASRV